MPCCDRSAAHRLRGRRGRLAPPRRTRVPPPRAARPPARPSARRGAGSREHAPRRASARHHAARTPPEHRHSARARGARESRSRALSSFSVTNPTPSAATSTFSRTDSVERRASAGTSGRARDGLSGGPPTRDHAVVELDGSRCREIEAGQQVDERRLAGTVRADQADDLVPMEGERHALDGVNPLERAGHADGPECVPGPPAVVRMLPFRQPRSSERPSRRRSPRPSPGCSGS